MKQVQQQNPSQLELSNSYSDIQDIFDMGDITGVVGGEYGMYWLMCPG